MQEVDNVWNVLSSAFDELSFKIPLQLLPALLSVSAPGSTLPGTSLYPYLPRPCGRRYARNDKLRHYPVKESVARLIVFSIDRPAPVVAFGPPSISAGVESRRPATSH